MTTAAIQRENIVTSAYTTEESVQLRQLTKQFFALTDPIRLRIIKTLMEHDGVNVLQLTALLSEAGCVSQSSVSRHLKTLVDVGFVGYHAKHTAHLHFVQREAIQEALRELQQYTGFFAQQYSS